jgi:hypothetical protein
MVLYIVNYQIFLMLIHLLNMSNKISISLLDYSKNKAFLIILKIGDKKGINLFLLSGYKQRLMNEVEGNIGRFRRCFGR